MQHYVRLLSASVVVGCTVLAFVGFVGNIHNQDTEYEMVQYEVVRIACQLPGGCDITFQTPGTGRPLTLRCRQGCVVMAQDTVIAQTTLQEIVFRAEPEDSAAGVH